MTSKYRLYSFFSSSCAHRIIIAAHLKGIPLEFSYVDLRTGEQRGDAYKQAANPFGTVPTFVVSEAGAEAELVIRQSTTALEYLEEQFPEKNPLLPPPSDPVGRALVRDFTNLVTNDVQPTTNAKIGVRVKQIRDNVEDRNEFITTVFREGFTAYEALLQSTRKPGESGRFTVGEAVSMADVVLVPAVDQALFYKMDIAAFAPGVMKIYEYLKTTEAFQAADWRKQGDTPEQFKIV